MSSLVRFLDLSSQSLGKSDYQRALPRADFDINAALKVVDPIIERIRSGDVDDLLQISEELDGVRPASIRVPEEIIDQALQTLPEEIRSSLIEAIRRVRIVHRDQQRLKSESNVVEGGVVEQRWIPIDRVGLYVPGGQAVYPSSVVMNVVPAQIAGVGSIALASPPQKENNGWPHPTILATCSLLGITEVYAMGGAQAIATFAFGIRDAQGEFICEKVDLVTGPGNIYVAAAKRALKGIIGIDSEAGPTEIAIIADESAYASDIASDLISQAEHDKLAAAILITHSRQLIEDVQRELVRRVSRTKHESRIRAALTGKQSAMVLVRDLSQAAEIANAYAAEHLELIVENPEVLSREIRNAGAVFLGRFSPVSLGDYSAGSNHVLPTGGCACHSSGLSVQTFLKGVSFITYSERAFREIATNVITLAQAEDLPAHGEAIEARFEFK